MAEGGFQHEVGGVFCYLAADVPQGDVHQVLDGLGEKNPALTHWLGTALCHPPRAPAAECDPPWTILAGLGTPHPRLTCRWDLAMTISMVSSVHFQGWSMSSSMLGIELVVGAGGVGVTGSFLSTSVGQGDRGS